MRLFLERQNDLVICKLKKTDHWFFSACYAGVVEWLGFEFPIRSQIEVEFPTPTVIKRTDHDGHDTNINDIIHSDERR